MISRLPVPDFYRTTNNIFLPDINSIWINQKGNKIKVTNIFSKANPIIICYRKKERNDFENDELCLSLQKFYSLFSSID